MSSATGEPTLRLPIAVSVLVHAAVVAAFVVLRPGPLPPPPPIYKVKMVAAPPGPPAVGVVRQTPATETVDQPPPPRPKTAEAAMPIPTTKRKQRMPEVSTPSVPVTKVTPKEDSPAPTAGGGETGGRGADVANVNTGGIDFPYPGYLENIVRQVRLRFQPSARGALHAEVAFMIRRDGSVPISSIRLVTRSGVYSFDLEAQGAVEAAANANAFGALPDGFPEDVLPVNFRFDPSLIR